MTWKGYLPRIPRLWRYTGAMVFSLSLLMGSFILGMRVLPHPGCVYIGNGLLDLLGGRYLPISSRVEPNRRSIVSPDSQYYIVLRPAAQNKDTFNLYLWSAETQQETVLQEGLRPSNTQTISSRLVWSNNGRKIAFLWQSLDKTIYLSILGVDGQKHSIPMTFKSGEIPPLESVFVTSWSPDDTYITTAISFKNITMPAEYGFWTSADLQPVSINISHITLASPLWSSTGERVAMVVQDVDQQNYLAIFSPRMDIEPILTPLTGTLNYPRSWSPGNRYLSVTNVEFDNKRQRTTTSHNIFSADGTPLYTDIPGRITSMAAGGQQSAYWGPTWSADGKSWIYISSRTNSLDLMALDIEKGLYHVIAPNLIEAYIPTMAYLPFFYLTDDSPISTSDYLLQNNRFLIAREQRGKFTVELADLDGQNRVELINRVDTLGGSHNGIPMRFWDIGGRFVMLGWSKGKGDDRHAGLTVASTDGSKIQTLDGLEVITQVGQTGGNQKSHWVGFLGRRDGNWGFELYDVETGAHHRLITDLNGNEASWQIIYAPNDDKLLVQFNNRLFLASLNGDAARELSPRIEGTAAWSADGKRIAFVTQGEDEHFTLELHAVDGAYIQRVSLRQYRLGTINPSVTRWTDYCQ